MQPLTPDKTRLNFRAEITCVLCVLCFTQTGEQRLEDVFRSFDTSGDGLLDRNELARILLQLMPEMDAGQVKKRSSPVCITEVCIK